MVVGACKITIHLPENGSLKGKRQIVKSVLARVRNEFNVAVAEVGSQDLWQTAELGIVAVSNRHAHVDEMLAKAVNFVERLRLDFEMGDYETEISDLL